MEDPCPLLGTPNKTTFYHHGNRLTVPHLINVGTPVNFNLGFVLKMLLLSFQLEGQLKNDKITIGFLLKNAFLL